MQKDISEQPKQAATGNGGANERAIAKISAARSRMRKCWKIIRARRRLAHARADLVGAYHSVDRNQMSLYAG